MNFLCPVSLIRLSQPITGNFCGTSDTRIFPSRGIWTNRVTACDSASLVSNDSQMNSPFSSCFSLVRPATRDVTEIFPIVWLSRFFPISRFSDLRGSMRNRETASSPSHIMSFYNRILIKSKRESLRHAPSWSSDSPDSTCSLSLSDWPTK